MIKKSKDIIGYCKESWVWLLQLLGRLRQEDCEFEASLQCISRLHFRWGKVRKTKPKREKVTRGGGVVVLEVSF